MLAVVSIEPLFSSRVPLTLNATYWCLPFSNIFLGYYLIVERMRIVKDIGKLMHACHFFHLNIEIYIFLIHTWAWTLIIDYHVLACTMQKKNFSCPYRFQMYYHLMIVASSIILSAVSRMKTERRMLHYWYYITAFLFLLRLKAITFPFDTKCASRHAGPTRHTYSLLGDISILMFIIYSCRPAEDADAAINILLNAKILAGTMLPALVIPHHAVQSHYASRCWLRWARFIFHALPRLAVIWCSRLFLRRLLKSGISMSNNIGTKLL